jgi:hypothetical protein
LLYHGDKDDTFVVSFPKSGTALVLMLLYQLRTDGSMDLPHISAFAPFLEADLFRECAIRRVATIDRVPRPRVVKDARAVRLDPQGTWPISM